MNERVRDRPASASNEDRSKHRLTNPLHERAILGFERLLQTDAKLGDLQTVPNRTDSLAAAAWPGRREESRASPAQTISVGSGADAAIDYDGIQIQFVN